MSDQEKTLSMKGLKLLHKKDCLVTKFVEKGEVKVRVRTLKQPLKKWVKDKKFPGFDLSPKVKELVG